MTARPIKILGAGPSGLAASIILAKAGREVHLHERYDTVGKRFQGDLQGIENWSTKQDVLSHFASYGININLPVVPFDELTITDGKRSFIRRSKGPLFYLTKRGPLADSLDTALYQQAVQVGVQLHFKSTLPHEQADIISTGPIRKAVVASDKGIVFSTHLPNIAIGIFHDEFAYMGYSYLLIANGYGCICSVVFKEFHRLNTCFEKTLSIARSYVDIDLSQVKPVGGIGSFCLSGNAVPQPHLYTGEAAGFQDMLWGFGIRTAITSGYLAAKAIQNKHSDSAIIKKQFQNQLKASLVNRYLWETIKWKKRPLLPYCLRFASCLRVFFYHLYRYSLFHRCLYPFAARYIRTHYPESLK